MKILLLVTFLTAGATTSRISRQAGWQFGSLFQCTFHLIIPSPYPIYFGCYCGRGRLSKREKDLDRCCQAHDQCYAQVKKMKSCVSFIDNPYTSSYSYSCSGNEVTCSDKNNPCEALICNCDRQAAICFSNTPYKKNYKGNGC